MKQTLSTRRPAQKNTWTSARSSLLRPTQRLSVGDSLLQPKLRIGQADDPLERDADRIAEQVLRMPAPTLHSRDGERAQGKPIRLRATPLVRMQARGGDAKLPEAPPIVHEVLRSPGRPLAPTIRAYFEARLGYDLGGVRVHTGAKAAEAAAAVNARAFTVGRDVVFGHGAYAPASPAGRRLLVHELVHVGQQEHFSLMLRQKRKRNRQPKRRNVVILLNDEENTKLEAKYLGGANAVNYRVHSVDELVKILRGIKFPIDTLFFIGHSLSSGDLGFAKGDTTQFVRPSVLSQKLAGVLNQQNSPRLIDFRGCSIGANPAAMEQIRAALGADAARGADCYVVVKTAGPVYLGNKKITKRKQLNSKYLQTFKQGLDILKQSFGKAQKCILNPDVEGYFKMGGRFIAIWVNPSLNSRWDLLHSKCYKDLKILVVRPGQKIKYGPIRRYCHLIEVKAPNRPHSNTSSSPRKTGTASQVNRPRRQDRPAQR